MVILSVLAGCGGGGSGTATPASPPTSSQVVSGVAATGSPLSGTVYLKDSTSPAKELSTTINSDGSFSFDVTGLTAPFLLKAVGTSNGQNYTLYSVAGGTGVANINPLSHLAVVQANGGSDPGSLYNSPTPGQLQAIKAALATIIPQIKALLQPILSLYNSDTIDFISDNYVANHKGLDLLFDVISIAVSNGTLTISNKISGVSIVTATLNGTTLSGQVISANIPAISVQTAGTVYVYPDNITLAANGTYSFKAIVIGTANQGVTWSVVEAGGGSISSTGVYTAPNASGTFHIKATSVADTSKSAVATVTVSSATASSFDMSGTWKGTIDELNTMNNVVAGTTQNVTITLDSSLSGTITGDKGLSANISFESTSGYWFCFIRQPISWGTAFVTPYNSTIYTQSPFGTTASLQQAFANNAKAPQDMQDIILADEYNVTAPNGITYTGGGFKQFKLAMSRP